jgi:translation initiation factor IF-1
MAKEEALRFEGTVVEMLPGGLFQVRLDTGDRQIIVYTSGKMRKRRIRTLVGDRVTVEMSPYDLDKGRLVYRQKDENSTHVPRSNPNFKRRR